MIFIDFVLLEIDLLKSSEILCNVHIDCFIIEHALQDHCDFDTMLCLNIKNCTRLAKNLELTCRLPLNEICLVYNYIIENLMEKVYCQYGIEFVSSKLRLQ